MAIFALILVALLAFGFAAGRPLAIAAPLALAIAYGIGKQLAAPDEPEYWQFNVLALAAAAAVMVAAGVTLRRSWTR